MVINLPYNVKKIINTLESNGHSAYVVGGCVRDCLLGKEPHDWDITTSATPDQIKSYFQHTIDTGIEHGTVTVMLNHIGYEVTTYRIDGKYSDGRHPEAVNFVVNLDEDLARRDFTINAMAYNDTYGLVDLFGGEEDLAAGIIRAVGRAEERFSEDALRMLRALRFSAQLGFEIEERTYEAIKAKAATIILVSAERIQVELVKLLVSNHPEVMRKMYESGITAQILPEFDEMMKTPQNTPHHCYSVGEHTIKALQLIEPDKILRLTMLLHDVSKPECRTVEEGRDHFHGHPQAGAKKARAILRRFKFDNYTTDKVVSLIEHHDDRPTTVKAVRRAAVRMGDICFPDIFAIKRADTLAQSEYLRQLKLDSIDFFEQTYHEILEANDALSISALEVSGKDLIDMGVQQGKAIGSILQKLFEEVIEEPDKNNREYLVSRAQELIKSIG